MIAETSRLPAFAFKSFAELFSTCAGKLPRILNAKIDWTGKKVSCYIDTYVAVQKDGVRQSINILPNQVVIDWIKANMLKVAWDTIFFEAITHDDGTTRVWAVYNQILGSCLLAEVDSDSITALLSKGD